MIDENYLRSQLAVRGMTMREYADYLGISSVTLYRKINGESDFSRSEVAKSAELFGKTASDRIFFSPKVS